MDAREAIIEAYCKLGKGAHRIEDVAHLAAQLMGGGNFKRRQHLRAIRKTFEQAFDNRESALPFTFSTTLAPNLSRRKWDNGIPMGYGVMIRGRNYKVIKLAC